MLNTLIFVTLFVYSNKELYIQYPVALIDTDSLIQLDFRMNCTDQPLQQSYGHADQMIQILNRLQVFHFIVQNRQQQIKQQYIIQALQYIDSNPTVAAICFAISSLNVDSAIQRLFDSIQIKHNIIIAIARHPLEFLKSETIEYANVIYCSSTETLSSSEATAQYISYLIR